MRISARWYRRVSARASASDGADGEVVEEVYHCPPRFQEIDNAR